MTEITSLLPAWITGKKNKAEAKPIDAAQVVQVNEEVVSLSSAEAADRAIKNSIFTLASRGFAGLWTGRRNGMSRSPREKNASSEDQS